MRTTDDLIGFGKPIDFDVEGPPLRIKHSADLKAVVEDPVLTLNEKRTILASWASDACAVDGAPGLRRVPSSGQIVRIDDILEALRTLDRQSGEPVASWARRRVRRASIEAFRERRAA